MVELPQSVLSLRSLLNRAANMFTSIDFRERPLRQVAVASVEMT